MSTLYGNNYKKVYVDVPSEKYDEGDYAAPVRTFTDTYELSAIIADGDIINLFKLTKGSRVIGGFMTLDIGATGKLKLGITGDDDLFHAGLDVNVVTGDASVILNTSLGYEVTAESLVIATCTTVSAAATGSVKVTLFVTEA